MRIPHEGLILCPHIRLHAVGQRATCRFLRGPNVGSHQHLRYPGAGPENRLKIVVYITVHEMMNEPSKQGSGAGSTRVFLFEGGALRTLGRYDQLSFIS